jgi:2-keto-4-pentenoate hydratase/2-oxohepta-3-ene-1,7-dioic acid hydratase in catechol pathway
MKLASYLVAGVAHYGLVVATGIVDLTRRIGGQYPTLRHVLEAGALAQLGAMESADPDFLPDEVVFLPPIVGPEKIWCIGINYRDRNEEFRDNSPRPEYPSLFARAPTSIVGHQQPIVRPRVSKQFDYEGEIVLVIGREGRHVPRERAFEHVCALTLCNEGSVRDWMRHGKFNVTQGKNFDRSGSIGPWMVTADELDPRGPIEIATRVNGETRQQDSTARLLFGFDELIAYLTTFATLKPGDLIATGTPTGAGARFDPPRWLVPGDVVEIASPGIGVLRNQVVDEA